jgi:pre-rRNA-processing protein TSR1
MSEGGPGTDGSALLDCATIERKAAINFVSESVIGPVNMTVTNASVLVFKFDVEHQRWQLIANGAMAAVDPDHIIPKKIMLYDNPIRVRKRTAVVRHMFYDPVDVKWFQPAELTMLLGLRGHIKEFVWTHS